jgi:hypothetical protein
MKVIVPRERRRIAQNQAINLVPIQRSVRVRANDVITGSMNDPRHEVEMNKEQRKNRCSLPRQLLGRCCGHPMIRRMAVVLAVKNRATVRASPKPHLTRTTN